MEKPIEVPIEVYEGIEMIRQKGIDMKDYHAVLAEAELIKDKATKNWLHDNVKMYIQGVRYGILPEGHTSESCRIQALTSPIVPDSE